MTTPFEEIRNRWSPKVGSPLKGRTLPEETKLKMSISQKKIQKAQHTPEFNKKTGDAQKGKVMSVESREKMRVAHLGKKLPEETKRHMSEAHKEQWANPEFHQRVVDSLRPVFASEEYRDKLSVAQLKRNQNIEEKDRRIEATKAGYTPEVRNQMSISQKERYTNVENREKQSKQMKELWQYLSPEERSRWITKMRRGSGNTNPTIPEQKVQALLNFCCPETFIYTGDGSIVMNGLIPDFTDCDGSKKVIEVFGDYWHSYEKIGRTKEQEESLRKELFAKFGFSCLIIWEAELVDSSLENTIEKIKEFGREKHK